MILSLEKFNKKLNEYNNKSMNYYLINLTGIKIDSTNNSTKGKTKEDLTFKDYNFKVVSKNNKRRIKRNVKYKLFNESFINNV